jgi:hypothetical protein
LKTELVYRRSWRTRDEAENNLFAYTAGTTPNASDTGSAGAHLMSTKRPGMFGAPIIRKRRNNSTDDCDAGTCSPHGDQLTVTFGQIVQTEINSTAADAQLSHI